MHADDVALLETLAEIFGVEGRLDGVDVAAQTLPRMPVERKNDLPAGGRDGMVDAVVGVGRSDLAGADAAQLIGTADALEIDVIEVRARRGGQASGYWKCRSRKLVRGGRSCA